MADVEVKIGADTSEAEKNIGKLRKSAEKESSAIERSFDKIKTAAIAAVAAFSAKQVFDFFKGGVLAAAESETAFNRLTKALELSGNAAPGVAESFRQLSENIERVTGISEEAIQEQVALAQNFGLTNEATQKLIIAATELSAVTGDSLDSSVQKLGTTFNGTLGSLKKTVPELQALDENALKAGKAIDFIIDRFGGSAAQNLNTFAGATQQVSIAFSKIPEAFGTAVVQNKELRIGLDAVTKAFYGLTDIINDNNADIQTLITASIKPLVIAFGSVVKVIGILNNAINGLQLAAAGIGSVFLNIVSFAKDLDAKIAKSTFGGRQFEEAKNQADAAKESADTFAKALQMLNDEVIKEKQQFDALTDTIFDYQKNVGLAKKEVEALAVAESGANKERGKTAEEIAALQKEFKDFYGKMVEGATSSLDAQLVAYKNYLAEYERLRDSGVIEQEKINKLLESIQRNHEQKVTDIQKKAAEDRKKEIEAIIQNNNFVNLVKVALDPQSGKDLKAAIRTAIGTIIADVGASAVSAVANGASGADAVTQLVSGLISKIPVFGGLVAELVKLAAQSPEENKKNIQGFVKGIPEFLSNINTNLGSLTSILNEVIGPIIEKVITSSGIGNLFTNLMKNIIKLPELIKTIALGVREGLRGSGGELSDAVKKAGADTKAELVRFGDNVRSFFGTFAQVSKASFAFAFANNPILNELKSMKELMIRAQLVVKFISELFQTIPGALIEIRDLFNSIGEKIGGAFENLGAKFTDGFLQVRDQIASLFSGIVDAFKKFPGQIKDALSDLFNGLKEAIQNAFSADKLKPLIGGGGGGGGLSLPGFASGITEVPRGFPNDSFAARLTSGERVVPAETNQDLKQFLESARNGGLANDQMIRLLSDISSKLSGGSSTIEVTIDKKVLGKTILDLNRRNERINA